MSLLAGNDIAAVVIDLTNKAEIAGFIVTNATEDAVPKISRCFPMIVLDCLVGFRGVCFAGDRLDVAIGHAKEDVSGNRDRSCLKTESSSDQVVKHSRGDAV